MEWNKQRKQNTSTTKQNANQQTKQETNMNKNVKQHALTQLKISNKTTNNYKQT